MNRDQNSFWPQISTFFYNLDDTNKTLLYGTWENKLKWFVFPHLTALQILAKFLESLWTFIQPSRKTGPFKYAKAILK